MPGEDVDDVDEPAREAAELLIAQANSAIHDGAVGAGQFSSQGSNAACGDAGDRGDPLRRPVGGRITHPVDAVEIRFDVAEAHQVLGEQRVYHREQQCRIGARRDRQPLVGAGRGRGAHRVDHNDLAPLAN